MKHTIRKAYWNYEKEEKWLNEMAKKGLHLDNYSWCKYSFKEGEPGKYIYRLELLENLASHAQSQVYLRFLEENGVEHVASYMRWVYLRKKAIDGPFDVYTDIESKINYYKRVNRFWMTLALAEIAIGLGNLAITASAFTSGEASSLVRVNFIGGLICTVIGIIFLIMTRQLRKKIRQLKIDREVHQ